MARKTLRVGVIGIGGAAQAGQPARLADLVGRIPLGLHVNGGHHAMAGGVVSGSALIRPDFVELLDWPHLWQQTEYVLGHGTSDFLFLVLAADRLLRGEAA